MHRRLFILALCLLALAACGGGGAKRHATASTPAQPARTPPPPPPPPPPPYPILLHGAAADGLFHWRPAVAVGGVHAAWIERVASSGSSITLIRFDQQRMRLALHAGSADPGGSGWRYGDHISRAELAHVVAAFNGGFRLSTGAGGFRANGQVGAPLQDGLGSVVTYRDGVSDVGAWGAGVPKRGRPIESVRQDLHLLVAGGSPSAEIDCGQGCWGATLGGVDAVARSAIGVTRAGELIWAAGEQVTAPALADALVSAHTRNAIELDINPQWVGGFLFRHRRAGPHATALPVVSGQSPGPDLFLSPYSRDFFTVLARH